jgi:hypothetical protein
MSESIENRIFKMDFVTNYIANISFYRRNFEVDLAIDLRTTPAAYIYNKCEIEIDYFINVLKDNNFELNKKILINSKHSEWWIVYRDQWMHIINMVKI